MIHPNEIKSEIRGKRLLIIHQESNTLIAEISKDRTYLLSAEFQNSLGEWHRTGSGEYADLTIFSFHPAKHIACGEGGMVTTNNFNLYEKLQLLKIQLLTFIDCSSHF